MVVYFVRLCTLFIALFSRIDLVEHIRLWLINCHVL